MDKRRATPAVITLGVAVVAVLAAVAYVREGPAAAAILVGVLGLVVTAYVVRHATRIHLLYRDRWDSGP